jgi:hypothetical protein
MNLLLKDKLPKDKLPKDKLRWLPAHHEAWAAPLRAARERRRGRLHQLRKFRRGRRKPGR